MIQSVVSAMWLVHVPTFFFSFSVLFQLQEQYLQVRKFNTNTCTIHDIILTKMLLITLQYLQYC